MTSIKQPSTSQSYSAAITKQIAPPIIITQADNIAKTLYSTTNQKIWLKLI